MKHLSALIILIWASVALATDETSVLGAWKYVGYSYQEHKYPVSDPGLSLTFHFSEDHLVQLRWDYAQEQGFCERVAEYEVRPNQILYQKVIWVNPMNDLSCSKDIDMQMDRESLTPFQFNENQLIFQLTLGDQPLYYILEKE